MVNCTKCNKRSTAKRLVDTQTKICNECSMPLTDNNGMVNNFVQHTLIPHSNLSSNVVPAYISTHHFGTSGMSNIGNTGVGAGNTNVYQSNNGRMPAPFNFNPQTMTRYVMGMRFNHPHR